MILNLVPWALSALPLPSLQGRISQTLHVHIAGALFSIRSHEVFRLIHARIFALQAMRSRQHHSWDWHSKHPERLQRLLTWLRHRFGWVQSRNISSDRHIRLIPQLYLIVLSCLRATDFLQPKACITMWLRASIHHLCHRVMCLGDGAPPLYHLAPHFCSCRRCCRRFQGTSPSTLLFI